jgi:hypothetical protein
MIIDNLSGFYNSKHEKENEEQQSGMVFIKGHHQSLNHQMKQVNHAVMN